MTKPTEAGARPTSLIHCDNCGVLYHKSWPECPKCCDPSKGHAGHTQPEPDNNTRSLCTEAEPTLEEWMSQLYPGANLDKMEIPARVCIEIAKSYAASREQRVQELEHDMAKTERDLGLALQDFMDAQGDLRRIKNAAENSNPTYKVRIEQIIKLAEAALHRESKEKK